MATKKQVTKKATAKKPSTKAKKSPEFKSFKLSKSNTPFFTFAITKQTLYWLVICSAVLALGVWVVIIQIRVNNNYDRIEMNSSALEDLSAPKSKP